jgi:hypothetical protein
MTRWAGLLACALVVGFALGSQVSEREIAQDVAAQPRDNKVTESDLEMYIDVYGRMQADHGLSIEDVLVEQGITLEEFRDLERRVQADQRMVDRVRLALLNQAKARSAWNVPESAGGGEQEPVETPN